ncbi:hypothetical protein LIER_39231 [Lithospermum erythrorhizon]|uniref:Uncharacterized protein n=1 Tax=Lithospermum erythrorhizon TaxID=34254 RepID=A0AAV3QDA8_LITER
MVLDKRGMKWNQNELECSIPSSLSSCINLHALDLSHNSLSGSIPPLLFQLKNLTKLLLTFLKLVVAQSYKSINFLLTLPPEVGNSSTLVSFRVRFLRASGVLQNRGWGSTSQWNQQRGSTSPEYYITATPGSPPPLFCGSPPSRVSNPLIQDARFVNGKVTPVSPRAIPVHPGMVSPLTPTRKGGFMRENFGNNPIVRVEGFDCLDRDRRVGGIPTLA